MTPGKIKTIIVLMCLSMIGLIAFQGYWIREALEVQNERFDEKVAEAVRNVAHTLEKQEIVLLLQQRQEDEIRKEKQRQMAIQARNKEERLEKAATESPEPQPAWVQRRNRRGQIPVPDREQGLQSDALTPSFYPFFKRDEQIFREFFEAQQHGIEGIDEFLNKRINDELFWGQALGRVEKTVKAPEERVPKSGKSNQKPATKKALPVVPQSTQAETLLREVIEDIVYTKRPFEERINRFLLDSLLRKELLQNGISLPFDFAVQPGQSDQMLFATADFGSEIWKNQAYHTALFSGAPVRSSGELLVYFPGKRQFVLEKTGAMMAGSALLVIVVMICFYLAVSTIIRQKKLSDIKNDFINNMTHELKTPISTIGLAVEMAGEKISHAEENPAIRRYIDIIGTENKRLGNQVERVLQTAQMEKGGLELKSQRISLHELIEKAVNSQKVQIEQRGGTLNLDFQALEDEINGDALHLTNVIYNLVDNAVKYSPDKLNLNIQTRNRGEGVSISVSDEGIGLTKDQINRIFEHFYRVPTGNLHDVKGFGLGLSYVKKITEAHGGQISVSSKKGIGSTFTVWLPFKSRLKQPEEENRIY